MRHHDIEAKIVDIRESVALLTATFKYITKGSENGGVTDCSIKEEKQEESGIEEFFEITPDTLAQINESIHRLNSEMKSIMGVE